MAGNPIIAVRACAGGHVVADTAVIGMTVSSPGAVDVWCNEHSSQYESALVQLGAVPLEM